MKVDYTKFEYEASSKSWFGEITINTNGTLKEIDVLFHSLCLKRADEYQRTGHCTEILSKEEM